MRTRLQALLFVLGIIFATAAHVAADDAQQVSGKGGTVTKNDAIDNNDEQATTAQSVTASGDNVIVKSKIFTPPTGTTFVKFQSTNTYVDVSANPDGLPIVRVQDSSSAIQVQSTFVAATAGSFPLSAEGNFGGGSGSGPASHWSAKVSCARIVLTVNGTATLSDDYVAFGDNGGTLTVSLAGYTSGSYTIALSDTGSGTPAGDVDFASTSVTWTSGGSPQTVNLHGRTAGGVRITAHCTNHSDVADKDITATVVKINSLTVAGAANVVGTNWAAVKAASGDVTVTAVLDPNITNIPDNLVTWSGGSAVQGQPLQHTVSKAASAKTHVAATCGTSSTSVDVWMIWASLDVQISDTETLDKGNDASKLTAGHNWPADLGGGNALGPMSCEGTTLTYAYSVGKIQAKATLQPSGIEDIMRTQWKMRRLCNLIAWDNGGHYTANGWQAGASSNTGGFVDDTSFAYCVDLDPKSGSSTGQIYDWDAPGCSAMLGGTLVRHTSECCMNFKQYVTVTLGGADVTCSDEKLWSYIAQVDVDKATDHVEQNQLQGNHVNLPANSHYTARFNVSGTITKNGNGLVGVTVTAGGKSATTAADGTYTINGVAVAQNITITPSKQGETFAPSSRQVTLTDSDVTGQDFTAN